MRSCLSSKYFFWDPSFAWLALGRYGALREIQWTAAAAALMAAPISAPAPSTGTTTATAAGAIATAQPALRYYYLGYYIHGCPKMSYKAEFRPSELLCPAAQVWVELDAGVRAALDAAPYVELSQLAGAVVSPNLSLARRWKPPSLVPGEAANGVRNEEQRHAPVVVDGGGGGDAGGSVAGASGGSSGHPSSHPGDSSSGACDDCGSQLLFLLKQPVRWGVLRDSGMIAPPVVASMQARLAAWRRVVGETAAHMLYAAPSDLTTPPAG
jgi:Arginine-tRNA-protein transferase, C terminus